ncbi:Serine--tRNA ligase [Cardinium endosymbiont cEper1 of Encarsia pergandiella]|uniref:serine--tRNA ligase n=1 Tax=Cardinium endosymbiont of Encarsia pergandiella TaxID=249402 RepID=UPI00027EA4B1|nr:serine--tRNA ligase [Cardinium endosymbiont of Encarsia pergandiella]CCM10287.1 Serine--tRNA ligase [Cardinium endosymbiont cEper1 of Encarsia pergandiella]
MIELHRIRTDKEAVINGLHQRGVSNAEELIQAICNLDIEKRAIQFQLDNLSATLNKLNQEIADLLRKNDGAAPLEAKKEESNQLKKSIKQLVEKFKAHALDLLVQLYALPNLPHESVPVGSHADHNLIIYQTSRMVVKGPLAHWDLVKKYDLVDFELGNKITGAGFPVYKGKGARLQRALINFFLDQALKAGYTEIQPPILVNEASAYATGQLPDKEGQMYQIGSTPLYLIPTSEVSITNIYRDAIIAETALPIKHVGYTPCFRREAGSWGADVRGLNRLHQFDKVELVQIAHPDASYANLEEMLTYVQGLVEHLALPYRVLKLCHGDLGFCAAMTYDIEVHAIGQDKWLEVSSISNFETFQSNRLSLRYKDKTKKTCLLHTLNGSGLALPRVLAALLELNQTPEGIRIPKVLQPYTGFDIID